MPDDDTTTEEYQRQVREARAELHVLQGGGKAKRMTLSEIIELLLARNAPEHSSVSLARNSKGETQIEVTVRTEPAAGVTTIEDATAKAVEVYEQLRARFPMQSGYTGAQPATPDSPKPSKPV